MRSEEWPSTTTRKDRKGRKLTEKAVVLDPIKSLGDIQRDSKCLTVFLNGFAPSGFERSPMRKSCAELVVSAYFGRPKKIVAYPGHVIRHDRDGLLQLIIMGKVAGTRRIGCKRKSCLLRGWTGIAIATQLFSLASEKARCKKTAGQPSLVGEAPKDECPPTLR
ncbi:jg23936 [Pararge aegeria aegeria]|uniref:Jg23936 protein n=1 Tax=Pararge aegeria aegeria TaxID=348720 RepID=A0A8S4RPU5_9NEOP|nr:jg23936 [Pararge aegeria aegeria]